MKHAHEEMLKVLHTVNKPKAAKKLLHYGVDGIISDIPEEMFK